MPMFSQSFHSSGQHLPFKLGKTPARPLPKSAVRLADYLTASKLPPLPRLFGHSQLVSQWDVLGNDQYGDCVWAGAAHEVMELNATCNKAVAFSTSSVLSDYSAVTGFKPDDPNTDNGTDMVAAAKYRKDVGVLDANGKRHKVLAYVSINPKSWKEMLYAAYLFDAVGIGIQFPGSAMKQFDAGKAWTVQAGASIEGGHYIPGFNRLVTADGMKSDWVSIVTWGRVVDMERKFFTKYCDEAIAYVSDECIGASGKTLEGFDKQTLLADLGLLK